MTDQLNIKELTVYKVDLQIISASDSASIEGFICNSYMFLDYDKAMDFAYNFAKSCASRYNSMSNGYYSDKIVKSERYIWSDEYHNYHNCWDKYYVVVYKSVLEFDNDIINKTKFNK
jgi:hypothetical protein